MPRLSAWTLRAALVYLLAGFTFGALLLAHKGVPYAGQLWRLLPAHVEFLLIGWTVQLILGVAYWILPRLPGGSRGRSELAGLAVILLNLGVLLVAAQGLAGLDSVFGLAGRLLQVAAGLAFLAHAWIRVRPTRR